MPITAIPMLWCFWHQYFKNSFRL